MSRRDNGAGVYGQIIATWLWASVAFNLYFRAGPELPAVMVSLIAGMMFAAPSSMLVLIAIEWLFVLFEEANNE